MLFAEDVVLVGKSHRVSRNGVVETRLGKRKVLRLNRPKGSMLQRGISRKMLVIDSKLGG